jgi:DNA mismatch endonuclease Vsr
MDRLSKEQRSRNMSAIKSKGTEIELVLGKTLWAKGFRYRKHSRLIKGTPDFVLPKYKIAIFCDSEFWHGKHFRKEIFPVRTNRKFWYTKIERNIQRDREINRALKKQGWKVFRFWGADIISAPDKCVSKIITYIESLA